MHTLTSYFENLLANLQPPAKRRKAAKELPAKVREFLKGLEDYPTEDPHTRLVGSYAQDTTSGDIKDVDFLVRLPSTMAKAPPAPTTAIRTLATTLNGLAKHLGYQNNGVETSENRRSVKVHFTNEDFYLDVVPCIAPGEIDGIIYVPDKQQKQWIKSQAYGYVGYLTQLNLESNGRVKPLIRLLKHFVNLHMKIGRPKSYWIGAMVIQELRSHKFTSSKSLAECFHDLIKAIYDRYDVVLHTSDTLTPNVPDPMLGDNTSWNWDRRPFESFMARLKEAVELADKALKCDSKDDAIALWKEVFGSEFDAGIKEFVAQRAAVVSPGSGRVLSSGAAGVAGAGLSIPATRFYGEDPEQTS